jgi:hypothetical protein
LRGKTIKIEALLKMKESNQHQEEEQWIEMNGLRSREDPTVITEEENMAKMTTEETTEYNDNESKTTDEEKSATEVSGLHIWWEGKGPSRCASAQSITNRAPVSLSTLP